MNKDNKYWQKPLTEKQKKELDLDLITEINELFPEEIDEFEENNEKTKSTGKKLVGLVVAVIFIIVVLGNFFKFYNLPPLDFLIRSRELTQIEEISELREAVVAVNTIASRGTGFNIDPSGLVITNYHVIDDAKVVFVNFLSKEIFGAKKIESFPDIDLAIIKINGENLPTLEIEKSNIPQVGDEVLIIGNPLGFSRIVKEGQVVGEIRLKNWHEKVLMIRGPIHKGSSGSPVFNDEGKVIAVIFATLVADSEDEITGLAVPIYHLLDRLEVIKTN